MTGGEANLVERVRRERTRRGWSYDTLARQMTDAGCPIRGSAMFRVENGDPPRRVTVDELLGLAAVFDLAPEDLLTPVDLLDKEQAEQVLAELEDAGERLGTLVTDLLRLYAEYFDLAESDPEIYEYVRGHLRGSEWAITTIRPDGSERRMPWPRIGPGRMPDSMRARLAREIPRDLHDHVEDFEHSLVSYAMGRRDVAAEVDRG